MKNKVIKDTRFNRPFEYLEHQTDGITDNWHKARVFVLDRLINILNSAQTLPQAWHFVVKGDSDLLLSVVRNLVLYAHFTNYEEKYDCYDNLSCKNRTVISLVTENNNIETKLKGIDYLGNFTDYCKLSVFGKKKNENSYIDIELDIVKNEEDIIDAGSKPVIITEDIVQQTIASKKPEDIFCIDLRKAIYANEVYNLGTTIENIPYEDINCAYRYRRALDTFKFKVLDSDFDVMKIKQKWENEPQKVKLGISNIICADCFEIREREITLLEKKEKLDSQMWEKHINALAHCEHNRWIAEKLILGFKPLEREDRFGYEQLFGEQRNAFLKSLKTDADNPKHIDICSNRELRRRHPDNMKYDSFLMMAIPMILAKISKQD